MQTYKNGKDSNDLPAGALHRRACTIGVSFEEKKILGDAGTSYGSDGVDGGSSSDASGSVVASEDEHVINALAR